MTNQNQDIHILHVDDEPDFTNVAAEFLQQEDDRFTITTAENGSEALDQLGETAFDCIVSDFDMPGQNGLDLLDSVRQEYPDVPFILYTGKGSEEIASQAITAGVTDYLQKEPGTEQYTILANRVVNAVEKMRAKRESALSYRAMDTANEGLSLVTPDGTFSYVNPAFADLFEYNPDELIGEHWTVLYDNEEAERLEQDILPAVTEHGYWSGETVRTTKHDERLVTDHRLSHTGEGVIVCSAKDLTPERTAPATQTAGFELLVDAMEGHAFFTLDHEGYITRWNEGAERLTGYPADEIIGKHLATFFIEEDRNQGLPEQLIETAKSEGSVTDTGWHITKDGDKFKATDTISASYDASGTIRGFGKMIRRSGSDPIAVQ